MSVGAGSPPRRSRLHTGGPRAGQVGFALVVRTWGALVLANVRYWSTVSPLVRAQLRRWRRRAGEIDDEALKALAVRKLREEHFNAEVAATLATIAPAGSRETVLRAVVALEVLFDYLDGRSERLGREPLQEARETLRPFLDAVGVGGGGAAEGGGEARGADGRYVAELVAEVRAMLADLPGAAAVRPSAARAAARCMEAQARVHAAPWIGVEQVRLWAGEDAQGGPLRWREHLAGACSSVLAIHALLALAARPHATPHEAQALEELYLCIAVMPTTLDSVVDRERDLRSGEPMHIDHYRDMEELARSLSDVAAKAIACARAAPDGAHHVMTLAGVLSYYLTAPGARGPFGRQVSGHLPRGLTILMAPTLIVMRTWRAAKVIDALLARAQGRRRSDG